MAPEERVAVFDNDGTLWCEKPLPIQLDFILRRLHEMAEAQPELRERQPWKSAYDRDYTWLGAVLDAHYAGDDTDLGPSRRGSSPPTAGSASTSSSVKPATSSTPHNTRRWAAGTSRPCTCR